MTYLITVVFAAALVLAALLLRNILRAWRASKEINARRDAW